MLTFGICILARLARGHLFTINSGFKRPVWFFLQVAEYPKIRHDSLPPMSSWAVASGGFSKVGTFGLMLPGSCNDLQKILIPKKGIGGLWDPWIGVVLAWRTAWVYPTHLPQTEPYLQGRIW